MIFNKQWNKFAGKNIISERRSFFITFEKQPLSNHIYKLNVEHKQSNFLN